MEGDLGRSETWNAAEEVASQWRGGADAAAPAEGDPTPERSSPDNTWQLDSRWVERSGGSSGAAEASEDVPSFSGAGFGLDLNSLQAELRAVQDERQKLIEQAKVVMDTAPSFTPPPVPQHRASPAEAQGGGRQTGSAERGIEGKGLAKKRQEAKESDIRRKVIREVFDSLAEDEAAVARRPRDIRDVVALFYDKIEEAVFDKIEDAKISKQKAIGRVEETARKELVECSKKYKKQIKEHEGTIEKLKLDIESLQSDKRHHISKLTHFKQEIKNLGTKLDEATMARCTAEERLKAVETEQHHAKKKAVEQAAKEVQRASSAIAKAEARTASAEKELAKAEVDAARALAAKGNDLRRQEQESSEALRDLEKKWEAKVEETCREGATREQALMARLTNMQWEFMESTSAFRELDELYSQSRNFAEGVFRQVGGELNAVRNEVLIDLQMVKTESRLALSEIGEGLEQVREGLRKASMEAEVKSLTGRLQERQTQLEEVQGRLTLALAEKSKNETTVAIEHVKSRRLAETAATLRASLKKSEESLESSHSQVKELEDSIQPFQKRIIGLEQILEEKEAEFEALNVDFQELKNTLHVERDLRTKAEKIADTVKSKEIGAEKSNLEAAVAVQKLRNKYFCRLAEDSKNELESADPLTVLEGADISKLRAKVLQSLGKSGYGNGSQTFGRELSLLEEALLGSLLVYKERENQIKQNREAIQLTRDLVEQTVMQKKAMAKKTRALENELKRLKDLRRPASAGIRSLSPQVQGPRKGFPPSVRQPTDDDILDVLEAVNRADFYGTPDSRYVDDVEAVEEGWIDDSPHAGRGAENRRPRTQSRKSRPKPEWIDA